MLKKLILLFFIGFVTCDIAYCDNHLNQFSHDQAFVVANETGQFIAPEVAVQEPETLVLPDGVTLRVNDVDITEDMVLDGIKQQLASRDLSGISPEDFKTYSSILRPRVIDSLINVELINQVAKKEGLALTKQDIDSRIDEIVILAMEQTGMTREELAKDILKRQGITIEESLAKYRTNKQFLETILLEKVATVKQPLAATVTDAEIKDYFEANRSKYSKPEMVRASHILVLTLDDNGQKFDETGIAEAKEKILDLQKKVAEPNADFAELAREFSDCPSGKSSGGDLGFFPRTGAMVEPFADAAYKLKPGQISDIVETQYGYHIIKCTERNPAEVTPLDEVKDDIRKQLSRYKKTAVLSDLTAQLRKEAVIKYSNQNDDPAFRAKQAQSQQEAASESANSPEAGSQNE